MSMETSSRSTGDRWKCAPSVVARCRIATSARAVANGARRAVGALGVGTRGRARTAVSNTRRTSACELEAPVESTTTARTAATGAPPSAPTLSRRWKHIVQDSQSTARIHIITALVILSIIRKTTSSTTKVHHLYYLFRSAFSYEKRKQHCINISTTLAQHPRFERLSLRFLIFLINFKLFHLRPVTAKWKSLLVSVFTELAE